MPRSASHGDHEHNVLPLRGNRIQRAFVKGKPGGVRGGAKRQDRGRISFLDETEFHFCRKVYHACTSKRKTCWDAMIRIAVLRCGDWVEHAHSHSPQCARVATILASENGVVEYKGK